jgi:hypothetical protein
MCLNGKNVYKSYSIINKNGSVRKRSDGRDMSNNALLSSDYMKLVCDFKSILKYDCNSEEE